MLEPSSSNHAYTGDGMSRCLGYVLSGSTSQWVRFQPREDAEGLIREGMLVVIRDANRRILGMISRIEAYHEFYEPGEVWSEALRQGHRPPDTAARRYIVAHAILQGVLHEQGLRSVERPPRPGSEVFEAKVEDLRRIYGYTPTRDSIPSNEIEIGDLYGYHEGDARLPAVLSIDKITMHLAVIGVTGSGKSNTVGVLIERLGNKDGISIGEYKAKTLPVMVFDANGDYVDFYYEPQLVPSYSKVYRLVFPIPGVLSTVSEGGAGSKLIPIRIDLNVYHDRYSDFAEVVYAVTRGGRMEGIELQLDLLTRLLQTAVSDDDIKSYCGYYDSDKTDMNCMFSRSLGGNRAFNKLLKLLDAIARESGAHAATTAAVKRTLFSFMEQLNKYRVVPPDRDESTVNHNFVDDVTDSEEPKLVIVDFSTEGAPGVDLRTKQFIVSYMLDLFFNKFVDYRVRNTDRVCLVAIEEAQNYAPNTQTYPIGYSVARNILALVATQGRKFGLSLALVTQRPSFVDPIVMSMMNTFIIHRISPGDVRFVELTTGGLPRHMNARLPTLETGLAIIVGQMNVFPYPIIAKIHRRKVHRAGTVGG